MEYRVTKTLRLRGNKLPKGSIVTAADFHRADLLTSFIASGRVKLVEPVTDGGELPDDRSGVDPEH